MTSIKEEIEQGTINQSVHVDLKQRQTMANLTLMHDPAIKLYPNKTKALKVYNQQLKKLSKQPQDKEHVIQLEKKLQDLGHVEFTHNLPNHLHIMLKNSPIQNFIPRRVVWKANSVSTPCRLVFDASQISNTGYSLNDILTEGRNNMNKLAEIIIRWYIHKVAFHTDIQKMYNLIKLHEQNWCLQRYIWQQDLDPTKIPEEKVNKTHIYGVKSSGSQVERSLRETAKLSQIEYPKVNEIVKKDIYVDDCISSGQSEREALKRADELEVVLNRGGFALKEITFSNQDPPESLSDDGESKNVVGMKWFPKDDVISLDIKDNIIPSKLT